MIFYRISRIKYAIPPLAFSGEGAMKYAQRWHHAAGDIRATYCSDSLALACLECIVNIRPAPRTFPQSVFLRIDIPERFLEIADADKLPAGWSDKPVKNASRDYGTSFLRSRRAVGLVVPTVIQPLGLNVVINPLHPDFSLKWVHAPEPYPFDGRLS